MTFLVGLFLLVAFGLAFIWAYKRHLDVLTGPWIARNVRRSDQA